MVRLGIDLLGSGFGRALGGLGQVIYMIHITCYMWLYHIFYVIFCVHDNYTAYIIGILYVYKSCMLIARGNYGSSQVDIKL